MIEKEAKEIVKESLKTEDLMPTAMESYAKGYLEAIEKVKGLVEAVDYALRYRYEAFFNERNRKLKEALAKYQGEK